MLTATKNVCSVTHSQLEASELSCPHQEFDQARSVHTAYGINSKTPRYIPRLASRLLFGSKLVILDGLGASGCDDGGNNDSGGGGKSYMHSTSHN